MLCQFIFKSLLLSLGLFEGRRGLFQLLLVLYDGTLTASNTQGLLIQLFEMLLDLHLVRPLLLVEAALLELMLLLFAFEAFGVFADLVETRTRLLIILPGGQQLVLVAAAAFESAMQTELCEYFLGEDGTLPMQVICQHLFGLRGPLKVAEHLLFALHLDFICKESDSAHNGTTTLNIFLEHLQYAIFDETFLKHDLLTSRVPHSQTVVQYALSSAEPEQLGFLGVDSFAVNVGAPCADDVLQLAEASVASDHGNYVSLARFLPCILTKLKPCGHLDLMLFGALQPFFEAVDTQIMQRATHQRNQPVFLHPDKRLLQCLCAPPRFTGQVQNDLSLEHSMPESLCERKSSSQADVVAQQTDRQVLQPIIVELDGAGKMVGVNRQGLELSPHNLLELVQSEFSGHAFLIFFLLPIAPVDGQPCEVARQQGTFTPQL